MKLIVPFLCLALSGCAHQRLQMDVPLSSMENNQLLAHYYTLQNESGNSDRGVTQMNRQYGYDRFFGGPNQALGNVIVTGIIQAQGNAARERAIEVRVELERRGWTQLRGLSGMTPTRYMSKEGPLVEIATMGKPAQAAPAQSSKYAFSAESFSKARGCVSPVSTLNLKTADSETFTITCSTGEPVSVRCESGQCRTLK